MVLSNMPYDLLLAELTRDGGRPFLTFYDDATGERVEVSVATFDNWVAKTAGLLRDGMSVTTADRVAIALPAHWQALVWVGACWAVGATAVIGRDDSADVAVVGPDRLDAENPEVVALSLRPLGGRFTEDLPPGVLDYAVEVPAYPDRLVPYVPPAGDVPAIELAGTGISYSTLADRGSARALELPAASGSRVLVPTDELEVAVWDALLLPLVTGGSAVLVRHEDPARRDSRVSSEHVTAIGGGETKEIR